MIMTSSWSFYLILPCFVDPKPMDVQASLDLSCMLLCLCPSHHISLPVWTFEPYGVTPVSHNTMGKPQSPCRRPKWLLEGDQRNVDFVSTSYTCSYFQSWFLLSITYYHKTNHQESSVLFGTAVSHHKGAFHNCSNYWLLEGRLLQVWSSQQFEHRMTTRPPQVPNSPKHRKFKL